MSEDKIRALKEVGVGRINHNLNTSREHHPEIVTTLRRPCDYRSECQIGGRRHVLGRHHRHGRE